MAFGRGFCEDHGEQRCLLREVGREGAFSVGLVVCQSCLNQLAVQPKTSMNKINNLMRKEGSTGVPFPPPSYLTYLNIRVKLDVVHSAWWYMMDDPAAFPADPNGSEPDMRHLTKPRGKGFTLRLTAPEVLVGTENPWTGNPFGREIKLGLNTRSHAEAVRLRDIKLRQIRQLEADALANRGNKSVGRIIDLTPENAAEWRPMREEAKDPDSIDHVLTDELGRVERVGKAREVQTFAGIVFRGAVPLQKALEEYLHDHSAGKAFSRFEL